MMACAFFSTSASVKAGFGREGGAGAFSRLTAQSDKKSKKTTISPHLSSDVYLTPVYTTLTTRFSPVRSLLGRLSRLPRSLLPLSRLPRSLLPLSLLSVMLATRRTGSVTSRLSRPRPPRSCDSLLKLLLVIWLPLSSRPCRPSLRSNRSNRSLSRSPLSLSPPRSRLELDLNCETNVHMCIPY